MDRIVTLRDGILSSDDYTGRIGHQLQPRIVVALERGVLEAQHALPRMRHALDPGGDVADIVRPFHHAWNSGCRA
jgi:hypothetical protein